MVRGLCMEQDTSVGLSGVGSSDLTATPFKGTAHLSSAQGLQIDCDSCPLHPNPPLLSLFGFPSLPCSGAAFAHPASDTQ